MKICRALPLIAAGILASVAFVCGQFSCDTSGQEIHLRFFDPAPEPWPFGNTAWGPVSAMVGWDAFYVTDPADPLNTSATPNTVRFSNGGAVSPVGLLMLRNVGDAHGSLGTRHWDATSGPANAGGIFMGTRIVNNTGEPITSFSLGYTGEQWWGRTGGPGTFEVSYSTDAASSSIISGDWTGVGDLHYTSQRFAASGDFNVNGRSVIDERNRTVFRPVVIDLDEPLAPGGSIWLRWFSVNAPGIDQSIGFDEIRFTANPGPSPFNANLVVGTDADPTGLDWDHADRITDIGAGAGQSGSLTVPAGESLQFYDLYLGVDAYDAHGSLTVDGAGASAVLARGTGFGGLVHVGVDGSGEITVTNGGSFTGNFLRLGRGDGSGGALTVTSGGTFTNTDSSVRFAESEGSTATIVVSNGGVFENTGDWMHLGSRGNATLTVESGGSFTTATTLHIGREISSESSATVTGKNSLLATGDFLHVGNEGVGDLSVRTGGVINAGILVVGNALNASGRVSIEGEGSTVNVSDYVQLGANGAGDLAVYGGGRLHVGTMMSVARHAEGSRGHVAVSGAGSLIQTGDFLRIGRFNLGSLLVEDGGRVEVLAGDFTVGAGAVGYGEATVTGADSTIMSHDTIEIGMFGSGILRVLDHGRVRATGDFMIGGRDDAYGRVMVAGDGARIDTDGRLRLATAEAGDMVGSRAVLKIGQGAIAEAASGVLLRNRARVELAGGELRSGAVPILARDASGIGGWGTLGGSVTIGAGAALRGGGAGLAITGDLVLEPGARLAPRFLAVDDHGPLVVGGTVTMGEATGLPELDIDLRHTPALGDRFFLLANGGPVAGRFAHGGVPLEEGDSFAVRTPEHAATFTISYADGVALTVSGTAPVDRNHFMAWIDRFDGLGGLDLEPMANPSGDGAANVLKFILDADPRLGGNAQLPLPVLETGAVSGHATMELVLNETVQDVEDLQYAIEHSSTLAPGSWRILDSPHVEFPAPALLRARVPLEAPAERLFLRLRVDASPGLITPWRIHTTLNVRSAPDLSSTVLGQLPVGTEVFGRYLLVEETDTEWLEFQYQEQFAYLSRFGFSRVHPLNHERVRLYGNLPIGGEIVDRWWGLPLDYEPDDMIALPRDYAIEGGTFYLREEAAWSLMAMVDAMRADGVDTWVLSAYRSSSRQLSLWTTRTNANPAQRSTAPPGHSEHQLGTTADLSSQQSPSRSLRETDAAHVWLVGNAARFGWRQSYTPESAPVAGYIVEPWHWRYLGTQP